MKKILEVIFSGVGGVVLTLIVQHFLPINNQNIFYLDGKKIIVTEADYQELVKENVNLKKDNDNFVTEVSNLNKDIQELSKEIEENNVKEQNKIILKEIPVYIEDIIQHNGDIAIIDNNVFYSQEILDFLTDDEVTYSDNKIFYGEKSSEFINLLDTDAFYDFRALRTDLYGKLPTDLYSSISMGGESYNKGFALYNDNTIFFNIKGEYDKICFTVGHIDGTPYQDYKLIVIGDGTSLLEIDIDTQGLPMEYEVDITSVQQITFTTKVNDIVTNGCAIGIVNILAN